MVRKRATAQKALTPEKTNRKERSTAKSKLAEKPLQRVEEEEEEEEEEGSLPTVNGDSKPEPTPTNSQEVTMEAPVELYNDLPDPSSYSKDLSNKAKQYWEAVKTDYNDFANWTSLLQTVTDTEDNLEAARDVYDCFLRYYPYCYGYWKKYSDIEKKSENFDNVKQIFERGVNAIPISIDLWVHYINFTIQQNKGSENYREIVCSLFNRALEAAGMDFKSNKLWDAFIAWEKSQGNLKHVTAIYDRLIAMPTQQYVKNWQKFKEHLQSHPLYETLSTEEYSKVMQEMDAIPPGMSTTDPPAVIGTANGKNDVEGGSGEIVENEVLKDNKMVKRRVIAERESIFKETSVEIKKRLAYEDAIKRPYFHVKPLEKSQVANWHDYLDYEIRMGGHKRICFLFERCLIACALYEEFWMKYVDYVEHRDVMLAQDVFSRACNIHLVKKYKIHLRWAVFEEKQKHFESAAEILKTIDVNFPGMILLKQSRVSLARRMKKHDTVVSIYKEAIEEMKNIENKIFFSIKLSRFHTRILHDKISARDVLWQALQLGKKHKRIYLELLELETHDGHIECDHVKKLFNMVQNDLNLNEDFQLDFEQRKIEFYQDYGNDIQCLLDAKDNYRNIKRQREALKRVRTNSPSSEKSSKMSKLDIPLPNEVITPVTDNYDSQATWYQEPQGQNYWAMTAQHYATEQRNQQQKP